MNEINLSIKIKVVERFEDNPDVIARIHYPDEGNKMTFIKGLNRLELEDAIHHEIGHLVDWYLSDNNKHLPVEIREVNACEIGEALRLASTAIKEEC